MEITDNLIQKFKALSQGTTYGSFVGLKLRLHFGEENFEDCFVGYLIYRFRKWEESEEKALDAVGYVDSQEAYQSITEFIEYIDSPNEYDGENCEKVREYCEKVKEYRSRANEYWKAPENQEKFFKLLKNYGFGVFNKELNAMTTKEASEANASDPLHCFFELIQNADDCEYDGGEKTFTVDFSDPDDETVVVSYNERGMLYTDIIALSSLKESNKAKDTEKIGEKGQGFKTIFALCDKVEIDSGGFSFEFNYNSGTANSESITVRYKEPYKAADGTAVSGTRIVMHLKKNRGSKSDICTKLREKYGIGDAEAPEDREENAFSNCPIMYTKLNSMRIIADGQHSYRISNVSGDKDNIFKLVYETEDETFSIEYLRYENEVHFSEGEWHSRYSGEKPSYMEDNKYKIYIAAPLNADNIRYGKLYTYLPTEEVINSPVNIHFPAFLDNSRSTFERTDNNHVEWNRRLMEELFKENGWYSEFFDLLRSENADLIKYLPNIENTRSGIRFFCKGSKIEDLCRTKIYQELKLFKLMGKDEYACGSQIWMPDEFSKDFADELFAELTAQNTPAAGKKQAEYNELFMKNSGLRKMTGYPKDKEIAAYDPQILNAVMSKNKAVRGRVTEYILSGQNSIYLPDDDLKKKCLNIFPCNVKTGEHGETVTKYYSVNSDRDCSEVRAVWVEEGQDDAAAPEGSYVRVCGESELFEKFDVKTRYKNKTPDRETVFMHIVNEASDLENSTYKETKQIFEYFRDRDGCSDKDLFEYGVSFFTKDETTSGVRAAAAELLKNACGCDPNGRDEIELNSIYNVLQAFAAYALKASFTAEIKLDIRLWKKELIELLIKADNDNSFKKDLISIEEFSNDNYAVVSAEDFFGSYTAQFTRFQDLKKWETAYSSILPEGCNFLHYNKNIVLKNNEAAADCANSMLKGITAAQTTSNNIMKIKNRRDSRIPFGSAKQAEELGELLQMNLTYLYHNSNDGMSGNERNITEITSDNVIGYELVQNANDCHTRYNELPEKLKEEQNIKLGDELEIRVKSNDTFTLEYPDAGFSPLDLIGICTKYNSGNDAETSLAQGKKGTGFKSLYGKFKNVSIETNYFNLTLSTEELNRYMMDNDGGITFHKDEKIPYDPKKIISVPVPSFEYFDRKKNKTALTLTARNTEFFNETMTVLRDFRTYLFTDNFKKITVHEDDKKTVIEKISDGKKFEVSVTSDGKTVTYKFSRYFADMDDLESKADENSKSKRLLTLLFPDEAAIGLLKNIEGGNVPFYCTLPLIDTHIDKGEKICFFVNAPFINVKENRKNVQDKNQIYNIRSGIFNAFNEFAKDHEQTAYKNYPDSGFYQKFKEYNYGYTGCFAEFCYFIPTEKHGLISADKLSEDSRLDQDGKDFENYILDYTKTDFLRLLELYLRVCFSVNTAGKSSERGRMMLRHYNKYSGDAEDITKTRIQTVIESGEVIEGYSNINIIKQKIIDFYTPEWEKLFKFPIEIDLNEKMFTNIRETLFENNEEPDINDKFAQAVIKKYAEGSEECDLFKLFKNKKDDLDAIKKLSWNDDNIGDFLSIFQKFLKSIRDKTVDQNSEQGESCMHFSTDRKLPDEQEKKFGEYSGSSSLDILDSPVMKNQNPRTIINNTVYYDDKDLNVKPEFFKNMYLWSADNRLVIFGKKSFEYVLKDLFRLTTEKDTIEIPKPTYSLPKVRGVDFSEELTDPKLFEKVAQEYGSDLARRNITDDKMIRELLSRKDFAFTEEADGSEGKTYRYHWKGYGAEKKSDVTRCPVCKAKLMYSAVKMLEVRTVGEIKIPLLMCKNCCGFIVNDDSKSNNGGKGIYVCKYDEEESNDCERLTYDNISEYIAENSCIRLLVNTCYEGENNSTPVRIDVSLTTPHRLMIYNTFKKNN